MRPPLRIYKRPRLRNPYLIIGWADAGLVGINTVNYLIDKLGAEEFGEIEPHGFSLLPYSIIKEGVLQDIEYPGNGFYYWKNKSSSNDLILLGSKQPDLNHYEFADLIMDMAELFKVERIYTVGGIYTNISHTEKPKIFSIINNPELKKYLKPFNIESGRNYYGPTSMNGLILGVAKYRNIDSIALWGQVPSYTGDIPNPQVCQAVLKVLTAMLGISIDFTEIEAEATRSNKQIDELVTYLRQQDPTLDRHIGNLEKGINLRLPEEDKQRFFDEIEEFLRKQDSQDNDQSGK